MAVNQDLLSELTDDYEILEELGRGGASVVYRATDRELGREVAIKVIDDRYIQDEETLARFRREARTLAQLEHPGIVPIHSARRLSDGRMALVMRRMAGPTLRQAIRAEAPMPAERAGAILRDIAGALAYLHRRGVVHRDVKPENIYLDPETGQALLSDFGIAKPSDTQSSVTLTGVVLGTPTYMSPEQVDGSRLDGRSDLYSLGLVGHEMLTGRKPWEGESLYAIIYKQKNESLPPLDRLRSDVPEPLRRAVEGALAKEPSERWGSAEELLAQLRAEAPLPAPVPEEPPAEVQPPPALPVVPMEAIAELRREQAGDARRRKSDRQLRVAAAGLVILVGTAAALAPSVGRDIWEADAMPPSPARAAAASWTGSPAVARTTEAGLRAPAAAEAVSPPARDSSAPPAMTVEALVSTSSAPALSDEEVEELRRRIQELERAAASPPKSAPPPASSAPSSSASSASPAASAPTPAPSRSQEPAALVGREVELGDRPVDFRAAAASPARTPSAEPSAPASDMGTLVAAPRLLNAARVQRALVSMYPSALRRSGVGGTVHLSILVNESGDVVESRVQNSSGNSALDGAAARAARVLKFSPARTTRGPVPTWVEIPLQFAPEE